MTDAHTPDTTPHADLVAALGALANIHKTGDVQAGQRRYRYVELDELLDAARPILAAHRLALTQDIVTDDTGHLSVTTILWHASGETFRFGPLRSHQPDAPQALGSIITYWRRYAAMAALGVAGADDDAQRAQEAAHKPRRAPQTQQDTYGQTKPVERVQARPDDPANEPYQNVPPPRPQSLSSRPDVGSEQAASPKAVKYMWTLLRKTGMTDDEVRHWVAAVAGMDPDWHTEQLTGSQVSHIIDQLKSEEQQ